MTTHSPFYQLLRAKSLRPVDVARLLEVDKATVARWARKRIPAERAEEVARVTGIPRHDLRPDLWDAPSYPETAA